MVKKDINKEFDAILLKHKIIKDVIYDKAVQVVRELEKHFKAGCKVGIYGVGIESEGLLYFISEHTTQLKIDVCFDKTIRTYKYKERVRDTNVKSIESIKEHDVDYIIIGSHKYRQVFTEKLRILGYQGRVVDLYDYMEGYIDDHFADYEKVFMTKQAYIKADSEEKVKLLQVLIKQCLLLKDFINACNYIDVYIRNKYRDYQKYEELKNDINIFLREIKECIDKREKKDIIINWLDALSYYDIPQFPFLQKKMKEGVNFKNAYTVMPWTTETTKTILFGDYPIEGKLFLREHISKENASLLKVLHEYNYDFVYCGMPKFAKLFDEPEVSCVHYFENKYSGSMQKQWDALDVLCKNEKPACILVHTLRETHEPFICGEGDTFCWFGSTERDWDEEICKKQVATAGRYIDCQLEFYENFYHENTVEIYMSDHGRVGNSPMNEKKIHVMLSVNEKKGRHETVENMFSLVRFPDLIRKIIDNKKDWDVLTQQYVWIENLDAYSERSVEDTLSGRLNMNEMYQCRGVVTATDRYYCYACGAEYYFVHRESQENEIENPMYQSRIQELKKLCGDKFVDIYKYDKFKYSRRLYTKMEIDFCKYNFI